MHYALIVFFVLQISARGTGGVNSPPDHLIFEDEESFGVGSNVQTILYNKSGEVSNLRDFNHKYYKLPGKHKSKPCVHDGLLA